MARRNCNLCCRKRCQEKAQHFQRNHKYQEAKQKESALGKQELQGSAASRRQKGRDGETR